MAVRRCGGIDLSAPRLQLGRGIVGNAALVSDVGENACHYFSPPLALHQLHQLVDDSLRGCL